MLPKTPFSLSDDKWIAFYKYLGQEPYLYAHPKYYRFLKAHMMYTNLPTDDDSMIELLSDNAVKRLLHFDPIEMAWFIFQIEDDDDVDDLLERYIKEKPCYKNNGAPIVPKNRSSATSTSAYMEEERIKIDFYLFENEQKRTCKSPAEIRREINIRFSPNFDYPLVSSMCISESP